MGEVDCCLENLEDPCSSSVSEILVGCGVELEVGGVAAVLGEEEVSFDGDACLFQPGKAGVGQLGSNIISCADESEVVGIVNGV